MLKLGLKMQSIILQLGLKMQSIILQLGLKMQSTILQLEPKSVNRNYNVSVEPCIEAVSK